jgi:hypothetical protein
MAKAKTKPASAGEGEPRLEWVRISQITPAKRNPKEHDIPAIVASIRRFGFRAPLIEDAASKRLTAGHGRLEAAGVLVAEAPKAPPPGIKVAEDGEWMLPVIRGMSFASEQAAEEYLLADNHLVELGGWNEAELAPLLAQIAKRGEEAVAAVGWSADAIAELAAGWDSDITAIRAHGSNTDGILARIVVFCPQAAKEKVSAAVAAAVKRFPKVRVA